MRACMRHNASASWIQREKEGQSESGELRARLREPERCSQHKITTKCRFRCLPSRTVIPVRINKPYLRCSQDIGWPQFGSRKLSPSPAKCTHTAQGKNAHSTPKSAQLDPLSRPCPIFEGNYQVLRKPGFHSLAPLPPGLACG